MAEKGNAMPYNREAEMAVLACMLIDNEIATDLLEKLKEDDFYQDSHRYILSAMRAVFNTHKPVEFITVSDELEKQGTLEKAGGIGYITELANFLPSAANYSSYYEIVSRDALNRKLIRASQKIIETCATSSDKQESLSFAEKQVYDISKETDRRSLSSIADSGAVQKVLDKFELLQSDENAFRGLETGFKHLDRMTNGLQPSDLIVLAARPGQGKTSLAMNFVEYAALQKNKVCAVFSLEMPYTQIVQRLLCAYAGVSMANALSGKLDSAEWKQLYAAADKLNKSKIYIDDSSRVTPAEIESKCRRLKATAGSLDFVMIDYIQLMSGGSKNSSIENRQLEVASITRELKVMAKELNVPVLALSQLRRIVTDEPQLSDLRESGAIEQDADIVMFINRPDANGAEVDKKGNPIVKGATDLIIAKHRNGAAGRIKLKFIGERTKFVDEDAADLPIEPPQYTKKPRPVENAEGAFDEPNGQQGNEVYDDEQDLPFE